MMPPCSWSLPGKKAGDVLERHQRDVERVAEPDEPGALDARLMSSTPARCAGWLPTMPTDAPAEPRESNDDVARVALVHLEEPAVVDDELDDLAHVVRLVAASPA